MEIYTYSFSSNDVYFSFVRPNGLNDIVTSCCCQQNHKRFDMPLLFLGLFS